MKAIKNTVLVLSLALVALAAFIAGAMLDDRLDAIELRVGGLSQDLLDHDTITLHGSHAHPHEPAPHEHEPLAHGVHDWEHDHRLTGSYYRVHEHAGERHMHAVEVVKDETQPHDHQPHEAPPFSPGQPSTSHDSPLPPCDGFIGHEHPLMTSEDSTHAHDGCEHVHRGFALDLSDDALIGDGHICTREAEWVDRDTIRIFDSCGMEPELLLTVPADRPSADANTLAVPPVEAPP